MPLPTPVNPTPAPPEPEPTPAPEPTQAATPLLPAASLPVSDATPFRALGDVDEATWMAVCDQFKSPLLPDERHNCWQAAQGASALILRLAAVETGVGSTARYLNNLLDLREPTSLTFLTFARPVDGILELLRRWSDPAYKGGVYQPQTQTLRQMYGHYAPPNENDTEALIAAAVSSINQWRKGDAQPVTPPAPSAYNFGPHPWPAGLDYRPLVLAPNGQGWDDLGDRKAGMAITVRHHTAGNDNRDSVYDLFSKGGGRWGQAATEAVIDRTGKGYLMLDPWGAESHVTPWASGIANALKGIGVPIVQQLGVDAVNKRAFAAEHSNVNGQGFTDPQIDLSAKTFAVVISREKIKWDRWPINDNIGGLRVDADHERFAATDCPGSDWPWGGGLHQAWVAAVAHEAKILQTGSAPPGPVQPPPTPEPPSPFPFDFSEADCARFWNANGGLKRHMADGSTTVYQFNKTGAITALWLARAKSDGVFPSPLDWWLDPSGWNFVSFGSPKNTDWLLAIPSLDSRANWRWIDAPPVAA